MARLQILELPQGSGDDRPPFVLVVDQVPVDEERFESLRRDFTDTGIADRIGARAVLCFEETIEIPTNAVIGASGITPDDGDRADSLAKQLDEARSWARHGYEIGQRHCGWTDHGIAPDWLTEGWPPHFDTCEHLERGAKYDEALARVLNLPEHPEIMDAKHEEPRGYLHGYKVAIRDAKCAARAESTQTVEDGG